MNGSGFASPSSAKLQPVSPSNTVSISTPEEATPQRKIYINGIEIENIHDLNVNINQYGGQSITLHLNPKNVIVNEESMFIEQNKPKQKTFTRKQLRDLIVHNLDNMEAIQWIKKLKLNGR